MDVRTSQLLRVLDPLATDLLLSLLEKDASEKELVRTIDGALQPNVHKKLKRLADAGVVQQKADAGGRGSPWTITAPDEVRDFLVALISLTESLDQADRQRRAQTRERLATAVAERPGLHVVGVDRR